MSSSFIVSSPCTVLLTSGLVGEADIFARGFKLTGDCGELNGDDARIEILSAFLLYVWANDVNLRLPIRDLKSDTRVAENMANVAKSRKDLFTGYGFSGCACGQYLPVGSVKQSHGGALLFPSLRHTNGQSLALRIKCKR